jgi:hypothetical protein
LLLVLLEGWQVLLCCEVLLVLLPMLVLLLFSLFLQQLETHANGSLNYFCSAKRRHLFRVTPLFAEPVGYLHLRLLQNYFLYFLVKMFSVISHQEKRKLKETAELNKNTLGIQLEATNEFEQK